MANCQKFVGRLVSKPILRGAIEAPFSLAGSLPDRARPSIDSNYQRILNLEPHAFIQFKYPIFQGKQVLFQDADGTIPVREAGDNIGRVVCPITGLAMIQTNQPWKPVWDGEKAAFSGSQYLIAEDHQLGGFLHHHNPCQWIMKASAARTPATQYFLSTQTYGSPVAGVNCRYVNDGLLIYNRPENAAPNIGVYQYTNGAMDSELHPIGYQIRSDRAWQITKDGCRVGSVRSYETSDLSDPLYPLTIGTQLPTSYPVNANPANNNSLVGDVEYLAIYKRELTQAETREHL